MPGTDRQWQGWYLTNTTGSLVQRAGAKPSANAVQIILMTAPGLDYGYINGRPDRCDTDQNTLQGPLVMGPGDKRQHP